MTDSNPKTTNGRLKPPVHAIPPSAIIALGLAMENGEGKYGLMNWRQSAVSSSVYYDAALRHLLAWWDGENVAQDSNVHHLAHVMACCAILIDAEIGNKLLDDRPVAGPAAEMISHLHDQRIAAAVQSVMPIAQVADPQSLAAAVDQINDGLRVIPFDYDTWPFPSEVPVNLGGISREPSPFWKTLFSRNKPKEIDMPTELETIIASVHRSEASSEKTRALVMTLGQKLDDMRQSTTDPTTRAQLLSLSAELDNETDAVDATEAAGEAAAADPAPVADPTPAPVDPAPPATTEDPAPVADPAAPTT